MPATFRARWVIPVDAPPIEGGAITFGREIISVGQGKLSGRVIDLGDVAILPGFVNAHTHLEFSDLPTPLGQPGMSLPDWIRLVIAHRRDRPGESIRPSEKGLKECLCHGTTSVGEIATPSWDVAEVESVPLDTTVFLELIGLRPERVEAMLAMPEEHCRRRRKDWSPWRYGLSPHAPYSTHMTLVERAAAYCGSASTWPLAMHLAESCEELELLRTGSGPFRELLEELGAWHGTAIGVGATIAQFLKVIARARHALVIHGNYLTQDEIAILAANRDHMTVVYCPRTHHFFRHGSYPLRRFLSAGVPVALGTDSRASNPDLSLLAEMRFVAATYPEIDPQIILRMGTIRGAAALGRGREVGTLSPGKQANLAIVELARDADGSNPIEALLAGDGEVVATIFDGQVAYDPQCRWPRSV